MTRIDAAAVAVFVAAVSLTAVAADKMTMAATTAATEAAAGTQAQAPRPTELRTYELSTETGMPNLEHNLRYAVVTERRCLDPHDLSTAFWMLRDVSLQDCRLVKAAEDAATASYRLVCDGGHGTSGEANWQLAPGIIRGTLDVRLGGKNMTFYQRIIARPVGACPAAAAAAAAPVAAAVAAEPPALTASGAAR